MLLNLYKYFLYQSRFISIGSLLAASLYSILVLELNTITTTLIISAFVTSYYIAQTHSCHKSLLALPVSREKTILADFLALLTNLLLSNFIFLLFYYAFRLMLNNPKFDGPFSLFFIAILSGVTGSLIAKSSYDYFRKFGGLGHIITLIVSLVLFFALIIGAFTMHKYMTTQLLYLIPLIYVFIIIILFFVTKRYFVRLDF